MEGMAQRASGLLQPPRCSIQLSQLQVPRSSMRSTRVSMAQQSLRSSMHLTRLSRLSANPLPVFIIFEALSKDQLIEKVHHVISEALIDPASLGEFIQIFQKTAQISQQSIKLLGVQRASRTSLGADGFDNVLGDRSNWGGTLTVPGEAAKNRTSIMTKNNRISIAEAIDSKQLQNFQLQVPLEAIHSISSMGSEDDIPQTFKAKASLNSINSGQSSQPRSSVSSRKSWLQPEETKLKKAAAVRAPKISLMFDCDFGEVEQEKSANGSSIFSEDDLIVQSVSEFMPPPLVFNSEVIEAIFDGPTHYHIALSLCLFFKFLAKSGWKLTEESVAWVLSLSMIVSYKIEEEYEMEGLLETFSEFLGLTADKLARLERWFLQQLNYEVVVTPQDYQQVLMVLMRQ